MADQDKAIKIQGRLLRIARLDAEFFLFLSHPTAFLDSLKRSGRRIDIFTFQQPPAHPTPQYNFPMEWEEVAILPVSTYEHWLTKQIPSTVRRHVKKAAKYGVSLREVPFDEELVRGIWKIYNESPMRQGRAFPHYGKDLETVRREAETYPDCSTFVGAYLGEELIGFIKLVGDEAGTQLNLMNILSLISHRDKAPTNALLAEAVQICEARKIPNLCYLLMHYGNKMDDGLSAFKKNNGFESIRTPRYFVPLTVWGRIAVGLGLHRRLLDRLPAGLAGWLRVGYHWIRQHLLPRAQPEPAPVTSSDEKA
jgi:hypothetical protein